MKQIGQLKSQFNNHTKTVEPTKNYYKRTVHQHNSYKTKSQGSSGTSFTQRYMWVPKA